ncbi:MAG: hypothetical protein WBE72_06755 [Terracidiphilus sp.]
MRFALIALLISAPLGAQTAAELPGSACGPAATSFKVKLNYASPAPAERDPAKAQVYFIHDAGSVVNFSLAYPTTKIAIDSAWAGANHGDSWFSVELAPGEHHVCATLQSSLVNQRVELAHFTAQPGHAYYFRTRLVMSGQVELLELEPLDSDQGAYLVRFYPMSVARAKK